MPARASQEQDTRGLIGDHGVDALQAFDERNGVDADELRLEFRSAQQERYT
jgi:hypothetical protein